MARVQIETVDTGSFTMDYLRFGRGESAFVILPGLSVQSVMGFADAVAAAYQEFSDAYTVYVFDRRNELPATYSVREMARDTAAAIGALGLARIDVFGASQGGMIALELAATQPDLVRKLALGSTSSCVGEVQYQVIGNWVELAKAGDRVGLYLAFGEAVYPKAVFEQSREALVEAAQTVTDEDLQRFVVLAEGMRGFDATDDLANIACPVLVLGAEDDQVLGPAASIKIAETLTAQGGQASLHQYDGYGHAAYDTAPDYRERLLQFFTSK